MLRYTEYTTVLHHILHVIGAVPASLVPLAGVACSAAADKPPWNESWAGSGGATGTTGANVFSTASTWAGAGSGGGSGAGGMACAPYDAGIADAADAGDDAALDAGDDAALDAGPYDCKGHLQDPATLKPAPCTCGHGGWYACFDLPASPTTCEQAYDKECMQSLYLPSYCNFRIRCGPLVEVTDACCYFFEGECPIGRPFVVGGTARLGTLASGEGWADRIDPDCSALDMVTRAALADAWAQEGLFEHASVASFARFILHLLALGAPADLVAAAQRALAEETDHARFCFGLASAYAAAPLGPGPLDIAGALDDGHDLATVAASTAAEGCIAETIAALQIMAACEGIDDARMRSQWVRMAEQEQGHALLAWRFVRWALGRGDRSVRAAVARVFSEAHLHVGRGGMTTLAGNARAMRAHGYLPVEQRRAIARAALDAVIRPAAAALLAAPGECAAMRLAGSAPRTRGFSPSDSRVQPLSSRPSPMSLRENPLSSRAQPLSSKDNPLTSRARSCDLNEKSIELMGKRFDLEG